MPELRKIVEAAIWEGLRSEEVAVAAAIRAAGQTRTDRRQVIYAPDGTVSMWAAELTSMSDIYAVCDEFREVLTLTGDWEPVELPTAGGGQ